MPTAWKKNSQDNIEFRHASGRRVVADFEGGEITSDGGVLLVRQVAQQTNILGDIAS